MIQEIIERAGQYYTGFTHLPIEGQVIAGAGMLVLLAALRNLWKMLYPVRWTAASLLRVAAFLVHPRKRKPKAKKNETTAPTPVSEPKFDVSTQDNFQATIKHYAKTEKMARQLDDARVRVLCEAGEIYGYSEWCEFTRGVHHVRRARAQEVKVKALTKALTNPQPQNTNPTPPVSVDVSAILARVAELEVQSFNATQTPAPVERATPSEADVA